MPIRPKNPILWWARFVALIPLMLLAGLNEWWLMRLYGPHVGNRFDYRFGHYMGNDPRSFWEKLRYFLR